MDSKSEYMSDEPGKLTFQLLKDITNNFDPERKLGSGASGEVYKGVFKDGRVIAIKKLRFMPWSDNKQFENEFEHLKRLNHQNIVRLVGFCDEEEDVCIQFEGKMVHAVDIHRALCLEFVPKGGLGQFLSEKYLELNWHTRFKIIQGTCHGLKYLHELLIMHFDLKPDNILLDEQMMPKIADFGLSRLLGEENTVMTKTPLGTIGYLPPEFINKQVISKKYDIFSLGVIIKRIVTGMDYWNISHMDDHECIEHVHNTWRKRLQELPAYASLEIDCKQVRTCIEIAVDCTQEDPRKRPMMNEIACRLSNVENKEIDSEFCDGQFYLPVPERPPGGGNVVQSGLESEDNRIEKKSRFRTVEFPLEFLREITNDFSVERIVSEHSFVTVFKGILHSGEEISVKRFGGSYAAGPSDVFWKEVGNPMEIEHKNILRLIGFCNEKKMKLVKHDGRNIRTDEVKYYLCHEYAQSGSLDKYIYDESCQLDWTTRFKIIMGVCEGLHFLHTSLDKPIVDTPLAPEDILLDSDMVPKLSDVCVLKLFDKLSTNSSEYARGYIAPEYSGLQGASVQSDIYMLGLLIMQIATGLASSNHCGSDLIDIVRRREDELMKLNYPSLDTTCVGQFKLCIQTAFWCTESYRMKRPSIREIVETLKSAYSGSTLDKGASSSSTASRTQLISNLYRELTWRNMSGEAGPPSPTHEKKSIEKVLPELLSSQIEQIIASENCRAVLSVDVHATSQDYRQVLSVDVHQKEPLMLTSNRDGIVCIWNYQKKEKVNSIQVGKRKPVYSAKFIERKNWIVTGDGGGYILVYSYDTFEEVSNFEAHENHITSLAVNPTYPFVLSASDDHLIKLWDWNKGWECMRTFEGHFNRVTQVMFHPKNNINFASASLDHKVKIWNIFSGNCNITLDDHAGGLLCLHYFEDKQLHFARQLLIAGSSDGDAKVWDPETHSCVGTLEGHTDRINALYWLPKHEVLVTGSLDGTVQIWKRTDTTYRLENKIALNLGAVNALGYIQESTRIVVGSEQGIAMVEINYTSAKTHIRDGPSTQPSAGLTNRLRSMVSSGGSFIVDYWNQL